MKVDLQLTPGQYAESVQSSLETAFWLVKKNIDTKVIILELELQIIRLMIM